MFYDQNRVCDIAMYECASKGRAGTCKIYSFKAANWPLLRGKIVESYKKTTGFAKEVGWDSLDAFEYGDGNLRIQRTVFASGRSAVANFTDEDIVYAGRVIKAGTAKTF